MRGKSQLRRRRRTASAVYSLVFRRKLFRHIKKKLTVLGSVTAFYCLGTLLNRSILEQNSNFSFRFLPSFYKRSNERMVFMPGNRRKR